MDDLVNSAQSLSDPSEDTHYPMPRTYSLNRPHDSTHYSMDDIGGL